MGPGVVGWPTVRSSRGGGGAGCGGGGGGRRRSRAAGSSSGGGSCCWGARGAVVGAPWCWPGGGDGPSAGARGMSGAERKWEGQMSQRSSSKGHLV